MSSMSHNNGTDPVCRRCALGNLMLGVQKLCDTYLTAFTAA